MGDKAKGFEFKKFATPRIIGGIAIALIILWALSIIFSSPDPTSRSRTARQHDSLAGRAHSGAAEPGKTPMTRHPSPAPATTKKQPVNATDTGGHSGPATQEASKSHKTGMPVASRTQEHDAVTHGMTTAKQPTGSHGDTAAHDTPMQAASRTKGDDATTQSASEKSASSQAARQAPTHQQPTAATQHGAQSGDHETSVQSTAQPDTSGHPIPPPPVGETAHKPMPKGVAFVEATIQPLDYELEERWWGWRPNDIINLTDNVNNVQMGVLEVTRRTAVALAERISRTGTTDAFDENLEQAMNWFMVKASSYWFPSAESKYREGLEELRAYRDKLIAGNATFYTRTDNLIPLLASFQDLLGSCDENLVKQTMEDGSPVSAFAVDNYFYYTQGVASAMASVLEAVHHDFLLTLESRNGTELLHHAIVSCQWAAELDPWFVLDRDLSSIFANHRANMAAPISHARFFLGQLIKTLST